MEERLIQKIVYGGSVKSFHFTTRFELINGFPQPIKVKYKFNERTRYLSLIVVPDYDGAGWDGYRNVDLTAVGDQFRLDMNTNAG